MQSPLAPTPTLGFGLGAPRHPRASALSQTPSPSRPERRTRESGLPAERNQCGRAVGGARVLAPGGGLWTCGARGQERGPAGNACTGRVSARTGHSARSEGAPARLRPAGPRQSSQSTTRHGRRGGGRELDTILCSLLISARGAAGRHRLREVVEFGSRRGCVELKPV